MVSLQEMEDAKKRGAATLKANPTAVIARYDIIGRKVVVELSNGLQIAFSPLDAEGLEKASPDQLQEIEITSSGLGLHFPQLDADFYIPGLLKGIFGSKAWMAARQRARNESEAPKSTPRPTARPRAARLAT